MTKLLDLIATWKDMREGVIEELVRIPEAQMDFRATPETRSLREIANHIVDSESRLVGEICRDDSDIRRIFVVSPPGELNTQSPEAIAQVMRASLDASALLLQQFGEDRLAEMMVGFNGKAVAKFWLLTSLVGHEMYHRGQITVYQRLLGIEPALTERFRSLTGQ